MSAPAVTIHEETVRNGDRGVEPRVVVWADRMYSRCPTCNREVDVEVSCPVAVDHAGDAQPYDQTCPGGCGEWLHVEWRDTLECNGHEVYAMTTEVTEACREDHAEHVRTILERLRSEMERVMAGVSEPSGSPTEPGVYRDEDFVGGDGQRGRWVAWSYGPRLDDEAVTLYQVEQLRTGCPAREVVGGYLPATEIRELLASHVRDAEALVVQASEGLTGWWAPPSRHGLYGRARKVLAAYTSRAYRVAELCPWVVLAAELGEQASDAELMRLVDEHDGRARLLSEEGVGVQDEWTRAMEVAAARRFRALVRP